MTGAVLALAGVILFSGCAFGRKHAYNMGAPRLKYRGSTKIALAVHDRRPRVISGVKDATFVGLSRGGYGNSFDIDTLSGRPLAVDFADTIARGLSASNYSVIHVWTAPRQSGDAVVLELTRTRAPRALLVHISEWKSDTYMNTALHYDVTALVLGEHGQLLAEAKISGSDSLGGDFVAPADYAESAVPDAYINRLESLLNRPGIRRALESPPPTPRAAGPPAATTPLPAAPTAAPPAVAPPGPAPPDAAAPPAASRPP